MHNEGRLYSQVAAEAGVPAETAMLACYLLNLSKEGKTIDEAAALTRKHRCEVRDYARDWGIRFVDYVTAPRPLVLCWEKIRRGLWELKLDSFVIATAISDGTGTGCYIARRAAPKMEHHGSSDEVAMRRLSAEMERRSVEIFGLDDIEIWFNDTGEKVLLAPKPVADPATLRKALASC